MTRLLDHPDREALIAETDKQVEAMLAGKKEAVFDSKGEQIGTTYHGDGSCLPETFFKTVVLRG